MYQKNAISIYRNVLRNVLFQSPAGDSDGPPRKRSSDQLNEDMDRMFENEGAKEDFSLSQLSSPAMASNPWSPGYSDDTQVREADDMRIHDSDIKCEFAITILRFIFSWHRKREIQCLMILATSVIEYSNRLGREWNLIFYRGEAKFLSHM